MRDLIGPDEVAAFWVRRGDKRKVRAVLRDHAVVEGRCPVCRVATSSGCCLFVAATRALARM